MKMFQKLCQQGIDLALPAYPIVELIGRNRLLLENHQGVITYSPEQILVKVSYGSVIVSGNDLHLMEMSRIKLAICGRIDDLRLLGR